MQMKRDWFPWGIAIVLNCFELLITKKSSLDSIRFEACDIPPTLSLFKTVRAGKPLRRVISSLKRSMLRSADSAPSKNQSLVIHST